MGDKVKRLHAIWMDGGYRGENFMHWVMDMLRWIVVIVKRHARKEGFSRLTKTVGSGKNITDGLIGVGVLVNRL